MTLQSDVMPRTEAGAAHRRAILEELARRHDAFELPPTLKELAGLRGISIRTLREYIEDLRELGHLRPDEAQLCLTLAGYLEVRTPPAVSTTSQRRYFASN